MMDITLHLAWWVIPTIILVVGMIWAIFIVDDGGGLFSGLSNLLAMLPVLFISMVAFIIAGIFK